jgi:hypothetical protein
MKGTTSKQGGAFYRNSGNITNTIVNVKASAATETAKQGTFCYDADSSTGIDYTTCFSIGVEGKVIYSAVNKEADTTLKYNADGLKELIGTALPTSYSSYWTYTDTELKFGNTTLLTFTVAQS